MKGITLILAFVGAFMLGVFSSFLLDSPSRGTVIGDDPGESMGSRLIMRVDYWFDEDTQAVKTRVYIPEWTNLETKAGTPIG